MLKLQGRNLRKNLFLDFLRDHHTWCDTNTNTNGGDEGTCGTNDTQDFIDQLNNENFGGYSDWRLPTNKELSTLVNYGSVHPATDPVFADNTPSDYNSSSYWTSTTNATDPSRAWSVDFWDGEQSYYSSKSSWASDHVRAVRGGQTPSSVNRYTDNGDTITDTITHLEWQKETINVNSWQEALAVAETLTLSGKSDWRLPDINELKSLVDDSRVNPATNSIFNAESRDYYSSTSDMYHKDYAQVVDFYSGKVGSGGYMKWLEGNVRAVRGSQIATPPPPPPPGPPSKNGITPILLLLLNGK